MLLLNSASLTGFGLTRIFSFASDAGFDGIELTFDPDNFDTFDPEYLKTISYRIPIISMFVQGNNFETIKQALEVSKKANIKFLVVDPPDFLNFKLKNFIKKYTTSKKTKIKVLIKDIPRFGGRNLNLCLDVSDFAFKNKDLAAVFEKFKNNILLIHLSNVKEDRSFCMLNEGVLPLESFLCKLAEYKFPRPISIKVDPFYLGAPKSSEILKNLRKVKAFINKYFSAMSAASNSSVSSYSSYSYSAPILDNYQKHTGGLGRGGKLP